MLERDRYAEIAKTRDAVRMETSAERFDRVAYAMRALAFVRPKKAVIAVCEGREARIEQGRQWGRPGERWAMLVVTRDASRRAIALAIAELAGDELDVAYAYDILMSETLSPAA